MDGLVDSKQQQRPEGPLIKGLGVKDEEEVDGEVELVGEPKGVEGADAPAEQRNSPTFTAH